MVNGHLRNEVWQELLDATMASRYYTALLSRHQRNRYLVRGLLLGSLIASVSTALVPLHWTIPALLTAIVALVTGWDLLNDYAKKAAVLQIVCQGRGKLVHDWCQLFGFVETPEASSDVEAQEGLDELREKGREIESLASQADISKDDRLNERCEKDAFGVVREWYENAYE